MSQFSYENSDFVSYSIDMNLSIISDVPMLDDTVILENAKPKTHIKQEHWEDEAFDYILIFLIFLFILEMLYIINPIYSIMTAMSSVILTWIFAISELLKLSNPTNENINFISEV